jgi:hypothetical protein
MPQHLGVLLAAFPNQFFPEIVDQISRVFGFPTDFAQARSYVRGSGKMIVVTIALKRLLEVCTNSNHKNMLSTSRAKYCNRKMSCT